MAKSKIDFRQLDNFKDTFYDEAVEGDVATWNDISKELEPRPPSSGIFGSNFIYLEEQINATTNSQIYQNYATLVTPAIPAGEYIIWVNFTIGTTASNVAIQVRTQLDGVDLFDENFLQYGGNTAPDLERLWPAHVRTATLTQGVHTFTIDYRRQGINKFVNFYDAHITLWRVS